MATLTSATDEAVTNLCLGIAKQAAKDYMTAYGNVRRQERLLRVTKNYGKRNIILQKLRDAKAKLKIEYDYLHSKDFEMIVSFDPDVLIALLEDEVDKKQKYI